MHLSSRTVSLSLELNERSGYRHSVSGYQQLLRISWFSPIRKEFIRIWDFKTNKVLSTDALLVT